MSCAYRLDNPIGPYCQEGVDDKDFGIGRVMLKLLKNKDQQQVAVFVVRYYGGVHLGRRRFEIAEHLTERALHQLQMKILKKRQRTQRQNLQSSLQSFASTIESQDESSHVEIPRKEEQLVEDR